MRRLLIVLGILLLVPATAFAATKQVLTHRVSYYRCTSATPTIRWRSDPAIHLERAEPCTLLRVPP